MKREAVYTTAKGHTKAEQAKRAEYHAHVQEGREVRARQVVHSQRVAKEGRVDHWMAELIGEAIAGQLKAERKRTPSDRKAIARADALYANWRKRLPRDRIRCSKT